MIIAIETSTAVCSVAAGRNGKIVLEKRTEGRGVHSTHLFLFLNEILEHTGYKTEDLEYVLFSNGPGSYTGLRIGASAIKGLLFRKSVPLFVCSTLTALSVPHLRNSKGAVHAVLDARRNHLYHQKSYIGVRGELITEEAGVKKIPDIGKMIHKEDTVAGTGINRLDRDRLPADNLYGTGHISAVNLLQAWYDEDFKTIFNEADPAGFEPEYLSVSQINNSLNK